ncbi:MAG: BTAD domain-containing putative transcriptional regulator [Actinomycetes bacterium]
MTPEVTPEVTHAKDRVQLTLFGPPRVERGGQRLTFDTRKAVALVAYLAITGQPHRRDVLAALLWPDSDQTKARGALRRTLSVAGAIGPGLVVAREEVRLDADLVDCDVTGFERLLADADQGGRRRAVELASDEFMAGFSLRDSPGFDDWQAATAERLRDRSVTTLAALVDADVADGRLHDALDLARRWLVVDPMSEAAHVQLMRLLTWTGQRPLALRQYRTLVRMLDRELGVAPLPETMALYDQIRSNRLTVPAGAPARGRRRRRPAPDEPGRAVAPRASASICVGREPERARLRQAWQDSSRAAGLVGVVAQPGFGRTTLVGDLVSEVALSGGRTAVVRAHEGESRLAMAAGRDLVRALARDGTATRPLDAELIDELGRLDPSMAGGSEPPPALASPGAQMRLFDAVRELVASTLVGRPAGLLVVEDAHWLDPTSADLLAYLVRRRPQEGLLVVATWLPGVGSTTLPSAVLDVGEVLALDGLSPQGVAELLSAAGVEDLVPDDVHRRTRGVPRLVVEYADAARAGTDAGGPIRDLVRTRLESASGTARQLLGAAAVLGTVADPELLRATAGRDETETVDALEEAVSRGLLVEDVERGGYDFPHEMLRHVVSEHTSLARQQLLHGRAADLLMRRHAAAPAQWPAAGVARHLGAAGRSDEAAAWYWTAAAESRALYAHREELDQLRSAQAAGFSVTLVHQAVGDALTRLGRYRDAMVAYEQAAATTDDEPELAEIEHKLAIVHDRLGEWAIAQAHLESAAELLESTDLLAVRARVGADLALVLHRRGHGDQAKIYAEQSVMWAEDSRDSLALAQVHNVLGVLATGRGEIPEALTHLELSGSQAAMLDDLGPAVAAANNVSRVYAVAGRTDDALDAARRALELGERHGDRHRVAALHANLADLLHQGGRDDEAKEHARASAQAFADVDEAVVRPQVWTLVEW